MKRIAIFLDGTWATLEDNTNVWRLKSLCDPRARDQLVYYSKGVGTQPGDAVRGGVEGYGIDQEIIHAYAWLTECFEPGDELFIFGFSRGAYTARSLSGLVAKCGVLKPGAPLSIEQLYARYHRRTEETINELLHGPAPTDLEERWIVKYCRPTPIKMVGVWETVGSLGSPFWSLRRRIATFRFLDTHLRVQNEYAFHALAVDENRKQFAPTLWTKTTMHSAPSTVSPRPLNEVEQRWFVGAHANVGGGYPSDILAQPPLEWLMGKAAGLGLQFRDSFVADAQTPTTPISDSYMEFGCGLAHYFSKRYFRPIGLAPQRGTVATTGPINETIDGTVFDRWRGNPSYRPANLVDWATREGVDPATLTGARMASDPLLHAR